MRRPLLLDLSVYWWMAICLSPSIRGSPAQSLDPSQWPLGHGHVGQQGGRRFNGSQFQHHQQPLTPLAAASVMQSAAMAAASRSQAEMCNDPRCSCSSASSSSSLGASNVSCHCSPQDQEVTLSIRAQSVPHDVSHLVIEGCRNVVFHDGALRHLNHLSTVTIIDVGEVAFQSGAFNQAQVERDTTVTVGRCRQLVVKSSAFSSHPLRPVAFYSSQCYAVRIDESAFSRGGLHRFAVADVQQLQLAAQAFRFATGGTSSSSSSIMTSAVTIQADISIQHATMTDLKSFTFPSPLHRLSLDNVTVSGSIESNATSALRIAQLVIAGSRIGRIATGAFSELTHLDSLEIRNTYVHHMASRAFASAASSLSISECHIGRLSHLAVCMPAARVHLLSNRVHTIATGALLLREWNELLIENNTVQLVERHAFYNIGEPKVESSMATAASAAARFVIRGNVFNQTQPGAFVISAQALRLQLQDNRFYQHCDCQMIAWAAELTQVNRLAAQTTAGSILSTRSPNDDTVDWVNVDQLQQEEENGALWLGSSLFNASSCWMDEAAAQCSGQSQNSGSGGFFMPMNNYTNHFCNATQTQRQSQQVECVAAKRSAALAVISGAGKQTTSRTSATETGSDGTAGGALKPVGLSTGQDLLLVIVWAVLAALVLLALVVGLIYRRRQRSKARHHPTLTGAVSSTSSPSHRKLTASEREERVTCSPLIPVEKQLGSGVVSSGSISRLSVKEYRHYLEELGPIYSEPVEPPIENQEQRHHNHPIPPAVPAIPLTWTTKSNGSNGSNNNTKMGAVDDADEAQRARNKMTIDRGTQTLEACIEDHRSQHPTGSLAQEFTDDLLAALRDKLDISPLYCEVRDSLQPRGAQFNAVAEEEEEKAANDKEKEMKKKKNEMGASALSDSARELYDLIKVVDSQPRSPPPPPPCDQAENIYCKPWVNPEEEEQEEDNSKEVEKVVNNKEAGKGINSPRPVSLPINRQKSTERQQQESGKKVNSSQKEETQHQQPFHIRASLPKWPPPSTAKGATANGRSKSHVASVPISPPVSPTKDTKPPWRSKSPNPPANSKSTPTGHNQLARKLSSPISRGLGEPITVQTSSSQNMKKSPAGAGQSRLSLPLARQNQGAKSSNNSSRSTNATTTAKTADPPSSPTENVEAKKSNPDDIQMGEIDKQLPSSDEPQSDHQVYSEVAAAPFTFSFRRPLFNRAKSIDSKPISVVESEPPKKPARIASPVPTTSPAILCDQYADPRDGRTGGETEPLYSELQLKIDASVANK